jgi:type II secretory pathway component GspD/PulD (secretin)
MCRAAKWLAMVAICSSPLSTVAQEGGARGRAPAAERGSGAIVAIEVLMADVGPLEKGEVLPDDQDVAARIRDLEKQGKLARITRTRLTTLSEQTAMIQFGERSAVATGRTVRGGGGAFGGPGGGGEPSTSYSYQNMGTLVNVVPRVDGGNVVLECSVESSRLAPRKPAADKPEGAIEPVGMETISAKSTVQVKSGETVLLASKQQTSAEGTTRTYVLVTATIQEPGRKEAAVFKVFTLAHAQAAGVAATLNQLLGDTGVKITPDERSNSVLARGSDENLEVVERLVQRLDDE